MNISINKDKVVATGKEIFNTVKTERGTIAAVSAAVLSGLCLWSIRKLSKIVSK